MVGAQAGQLLAAEAGLERAVDVDSGQGVDRPAPAAGSRWARDSLGQRTAVGDGVRVGAAYRTE